MALYLISYDISEKDEFEYGPLWAKLGEMGAARILYSEWLAIGDRVLHIYNPLAALVQAKDRLLVQEIGTTAAWDKLMISDDDFRAWLAHARF